MYQSPTTYGPVYDDWGGIIGFGPYDSTGGGTLSGGVAYFSDGTDGYAFGELVNGGNNMGWFDFANVGGGGVTIGGGGTGSPGGGINVTLPPIGGGGGGGPDINETLTAIVDAAEIALKANLASWQQQQLSASDAIARGWAILNTLVQRLTIYGAEGSKAAAERDRRVDPSRLRWDWIAYYIDSITGGPSPLEPLPVGVPVGFGGGGVPVVGGGGGGFGVVTDPTYLYLIGGVLLLVLAMRGTRS